MSLSFVLGLISTKGLTFRTGTEKHTMVCAGPMSRHAEDLAPFLRVLVAKEYIHRLKLDDDVCFIVIITIISKSLIYSVPWNNASFQ